MTFEILAKDAAGRLGKWTTPRGTIETPTIAIVVNPNVALVQPKEIKKLGFPLIMTNSYILMRSPRRQDVLEKGVHEFLGWDGTVYTDSGAYQLYSQSARVDPKETLEFQKAIRSDVVTPLDVFTLPTDDRKTVVRKMQETDKRYRKLPRTKNTFIVGPVQGGRFMDLRKKASLMTRRYDFDLYAIGGIVPLMESYDYKTLCDIIVTCKSALPLNKPVHAFGAGHPITFALLVALGCDVFDSAMYAIAARRGGYLTVNGTLEIGTLKEFPCACPVCTTHTPADVHKMEAYERERTLALHNLHVTATELRLVRQALREQWLWELVAQRTRAHPRLYEAFVHALQKHKKYFQEFEPVTKKSALFYTGEESAYRPEVVRAREWAKRVRTTRHVKKEPFGRVPAELLGVYPLGQSVVPDNPQTDTRPESVVRATIDYLYGRGACKAFKKMRVEVSRRTERVRRVYDRGVLVGTMRAQDGFFVPTFAGALALHKRARSNHVVVIGDAVPFVVQGKSVFAKFVCACQGVKAGEEVFIVDKKNRLIATGTALLSEKEILAADHGVAVAVRHTLSQKSDTISD